MLAKVEERFVIANSFLDMIYKNFVHIFLARIFSNITIEEKL